jgi:hypothetical protein
MPWRGPEYEGEFPTLGFHVLDLIAEYLRVPSGPRAGEQLRLTDEQALFFLRWYALDPETGRFPFRRAVIRRPKGWGKSPGIAAPFAFVEFVGDVQFDGWDAYGEPVGRPWPTPWIQAAAVSEDQTDNTFVALYEMLVNSAAIDDFHLDLGVTRIFKAGHPGSRIEPVTSSDGSREGQPITAAILDQTETWKRGNGGIRLAAVLRRNATKSGGRTIETPNAHAPGDGSVAEASHQAYLKGAAGVLYDSREPSNTNIADELHDRESLRVALREAYGDSIEWAGGGDIERLIDDIQDPATEPSDALRWFLNLIVKGTGRAVDPKQWAALEVAGLVPPVGERIGVGFDGSISDDSTALIGCTRAGHKFVIKIWERPLDANGRPLRDWRVPRHEVHDAVAATFDRWTVGQMFCDPAKWWTEIEGWQAEYGDVVVAFDTNSTRRFAPACDRFATSIAEGRGSHDGDPTLTRHVLNMAKKPVRSTDELDDGRQRFVYVKSGTGKIDAGIGAVLAEDAAMTMPDEAEVVLDGALMA